ncbi:hypothetical protein V9T40_002664 [Parthenolecanium corni]|uniref:DDB1- and CUL4-associated factor 5 n=1 Tax=Parthenolecanium corni TaxID=536013 RepID=A0AAN9TXD3_9HEMI
MNFKNTNPCKILFNRETDKNSDTCNRIISDLLSRKTERFYRKDLVAHYGCVNAIEFSNNGQFLVSGGDDRRVLLWNVQKALHNHGKPTVMRSEHNSNIFCLAFDNSITHIYSAGNDDQVILHDLHTGKALDVFNLEQPVYGISVNPFDDHVFASAVDDGRILIFDTRLKPSCDPYKLASSKSAFHAVMYNPVEPRLLATANSKKGTALWDVRTANKVLMQFGRKGGCMNVRWDQTGRKILALRRRQTPVLYEIGNPEPIAQFVHSKYENSVTMKSCCFAGLKDEYVLSGSDDFDLYMWKISDVMKSDESSNNEHMVLRGHRSIVNQVRFDPYNCIIASSGVEKVIKIWSPLPLPEGSRITSNWMRKIYSHQEYMYMILRNESFMSHDYSEQSTTEDPQMLAFFDSLIQRARDGSASDSNDMSSDENILCNSNSDLVDAHYSSLSDDYLDSSDEESSDGSDNIRRRIRRRLLSAKSSLNLLRHANATSASNTANHSQEGTLSPDVSSLSSTSFVASPSSSTTVSSSSDDDNDDTNDRHDTDDRSAPRLPTSAASPSSFNKRKLKLSSSSSRGSNAADTQHRFKRARILNFEPPSDELDSVFDRGSSGSGGTSTDTVDSGVYVDSLPKFKFGSFKRNDKRKYRSRKKSSSSSSSSSSLSSSDTDC